MAFGSSVGCTTDAKHSLCNARIALMQFTRAAASVGKDRGLELRARPRSGYYIQVGMHFGASTIAKGLLCLIPVLPMKLHWLDRVALLLVPRNTPADTKRERSAQTNRKPLTLKER